MGEPRVEKTLLCQCHTSRLDRSTKPITLYTLWLGPEFIEIFHLKIYFSLGILIEMVTVCKRSHCFLGN